MSDIEMVIKIPEEAKKAFDRAESNELKGGYYDHGGVIGAAIINGTPLPKGHSRLVKVDDVYDAFRPYVGFDDLYDVLCKIPTIIEAESEETDADSN